MKVHFFFFFLFRQILDFHSWSTFLSVDLRFFNVITKHCVFHLHVSLVLILFGPLRCVSSSYVSFAIFFFFSIFAIERSYFNDSKLKEIRMTVRILEDPVQTNFKNKIRFLTYRGLFTLCIINAHKCQSFSHISLDGA